MHAAIIVLLVSEIHTWEVFLGIVFFYYVLRNDFFMLNVLCSTCYSISQVCFHPVNHSCVFLSLYQRSAGITPVVDVDGYPILLPSRC